MNHRVVSLLSFAVLVIVIAVMLLRQSLVADGYVAVGIQILSVLLMIWARITFGRRSFHASATPTEGGLVTSGPYRYYRHPIYAAILYFIWAGVLTRLSFVNISLAAIATAAVGLRIIAEESLVMQRYPEYCDYAARTKRIIPFIF